MGETFFGGEDAFGSNGFDDFDFGDGDFGGGDNSFPSSSNSSDDPFSSFDSGFDSGFNSNSNSSDGFGSFDTSQNQNESIGDFSGQFDNTPSTPASGDKSKLKKTAIIAVAIGTIVSLGALVVGTKVINKDKGNTVTKDGITYVNQETNEGKDVSNIVSSGNNTPSNVVVQNTPKSEWTEIKKDEAITFNEEYSQHRFTITDIKYYGKLTDNVFVVRVELTGSISGLSGTHKIDVPYNIGNKLNIGNEFDVQVLLGSFNGKRVVGDIKY